MGQWAGSSRRSHRRAIGTVVAGSVILAACATGSAAPRSQATSRATSTTSTSTTATSTTTPQVSTTAAAAHNGRGRLAAPVEPAAPPLEIRHATLTTENWVTYDYRTGPDTVTVAAPAGLTDSNVREIFWPSGTMPTVDDEVCISWDETSESVEGQPIQPGLAMRIASVGSHNEGLRAITLTENVWYSGVWVFNVHVWDTRNLAKPLTQIASFDLSKIVGKLERSSSDTWETTLAPPPWHLCGRTQGDRFSFKVWTGTNPEPGWDDADAVFSTVLPDGWTYSGYSGGYLGHLHDGQSATATFESTGSAG